MLKPENKDQIDHWNGEAGDKWVDMAELLDAMLAPHGQKVIEATPLAEGNHVLDIGCGGGALSLMAAQKIGADGRITGVDVSEALLALARKRADKKGIKADFLHEDASDFTLPEKADHALSRFGVMFFAQPAKALATIKNNVKKGGQFSFVCWQGLKQNEWGRMPLEAAKKFLKTPPEMPPPHSPGPFGFADRDYLREVLREAEWQNISIEPLLSKMAMPGRDTREAAQFMLEMGPVSRLLQEQDIDMAPVEEALTTLLENKPRQDGKVLLESQAWLVTAKPYGIYGSSAKPA